MDQLQHLLQLSAKLYDHLGNVPNRDDREAFIEQINEQLAERGKVIFALNEKGFIIDMENKTHILISQLDKGIRERLNNVMNAVKQDMRDLQNAKKNEKQYMNPYADVRVMDGMYYDKRK